MDRGSCRICARSENSVFERGNRGLPIGLTERNQPHAGGHQIGDVALQVSRQRENQWDCLFCAADAKDEGHGEWYAAVQEVFRDFTQEGIRPHLAESCVIRGGLLRRFERDLFPWLGARPIESITTPEIRSVLLKIQARGAIATAHRAKW